MLQQKSSKYHRAKLFSAICQIAVAEVNLITPRIPESGARLRPLIAGNCVLFQGHSLNLAAAPMTLELFRTFLESEEHRATRFDIARKVYGIVDPESKSERFWSATKLNITKLISRARKQAAEHLSPGAGCDMMWFTFSPSEETWDLYTLKKDTHPDWVH